MIEGVDRLVDLVGTRSAGLTGASEAQVAEWTARCDGDALAQTDGHFAAVGRDGKTVRLARTIGIPLRYFVAKMYHGPFLVVADRMDRIFAWCQEQRIAWQFEPAYTRMVPAHYLVELDQVGCPGSGAEVSAVLRSASRARFNRSARSGCGVHHVRRPVP